MSDDFWYYGDYYSGYEAGKQQAKADAASDGCIMAVLGLIIGLFALFILFMPGIFCAYLILEVAKIHLYAVNPWRYISFLAVLTYLIECLIFLLKGWSLSLKERQKGLWMLLWGICFLYCFALPLLIARSMIFYGFKPAPHHPVDTLNLISWIAGALLGWLVYRRYRLNVDSAPKLMKWSYLLGRRASA